jgi:hypothetical protein
MPTDLELEGARLLQETNGDINKADAATKLAANVFFESLMAIRQDALKAKTPKDRANPHLVPFYKSWSEQRQIEEMNKSVQQ